MSRPEEQPDNPYNAPQLAAMKQDIADRSFRVRMIGMAITALFAVAGIAAMFLLPGGAGMAKPILYGALALGGGITTLITMKEAKKLEMDESYLQSYMQGKNYWGAGYRQEVAEHGYAGPSPLMSGPPGKRHKAGERDH